MHYSEEKYYRNLCEELMQRISILEAKVKQAKKKQSKKLDPVGKEDEDVDNDGKANTKTDKYLANRRKKIQAAMGKGKVISEGIIYGGFPIVKKENN